MMRKTAFFDLDGTIIQGSAGLELARILSKTDRSSKWRDFWENQRLFGNETANYDDVIEILSTCFARGVKDEDTHTIHCAVEDLKRRIKITDDFPDLYAWLVEEGFETFVLTASPIEVFAAIPFKFTEVFGLVLEQDGKYTGRCSRVMATRTKRTIISEKKRSSFFSFGVTDSIHDLQAYKDLDMQFLLDSDPHNGKPIVVGSFLEVKDKISSHFGLMRTKTENKSLQGSYW